MAIGAGQDPGPERRGRSRAADGAGGPSSWPTRRSTSILQGDTYVVLATVLDETGDAADAEEARAAALERYERKGDRVSADRLRDRSAREVTGAPAATSSP